MRLDGALEPRRNGAAAAIAAAAVGGCSSGVLQSLSDWQRSTDVRAYQRRPEVAVDDADADKTMKNSSLSLRQGRNNVAGRLLSQSICTNNNNGIIHDNNNNNESRNICVQQSPRTVAMSFGACLGRIVAAVGGGGGGKVRVQHSLPGDTTANNKNTSSNNGGGCCLRQRRAALPLLWLFCALVALSASARGDDSDNFFGVNSFSLAPENTTPHFDYASRGLKKFGDKCDNTLQCGFPGSICDPKKKSCQCTEDLPVTNHIDKCGKEAAVNESCFFNEQCEQKYFQTECRDGRCVCRFEMTPIWGKDGSVECKGRQDKRGNETYIDPAMIGVLVGMALMFIIICVVLRLFSQARWRENRTIFNTPNPRLMNVSLLRDSKLLHGQERRGSRMSVRAPSRQPSMASLRPHSPNPSLGSRNDSHGSASNTSVRSTRSNSVAPGHVVNSGHHERKGSGHHQHHQHQQHHHQSAHQPPHPPQPPVAPHITPNPAADNVTVEIIQP